jgi:archaellum component FlaF (FlaF/FlaG flagellin family)
MTQEYKMPVGKAILFLASLLCFACIGSKAIDRHAEIIRLKEMRQTVTDTQKNTVVAVIESMETQQSFYLQNCKK